MVFVAFVIGTPGCASLGRRVTTESETTAAATALPADSSVVRQSLYRLTHDSGEGRTSLKVVLREGADERFQVTLSDLAGRRVLSLDHLPDRIVLVDHREESYCVTGEGLTLPEVHPQELPLSAVPRVLAGRFPIVGVEGAAKGSGEFNDDAGRSWRVEEDSTGLTSWSLLDAGGPSLWWSRDEEGGILSRRGGDQYRWRLVVREDTPQPLVDLVPEGYVEGVCDG